MKLRCARFSITGLAYDINVFYWKSPEACPSTLNPKICFRRMFDGIVENAAFQMLAPFGSISGENPSTD